MSNIIPPLLSDSPPPLSSDEDEEDDEFGHFGRNDDESFAYSCDNLSLPSSPVKLPDIDSTGLNHKLDINSNSKEDINSIQILNVEKDFHDKRKSSVHIDTVNLDISDNNVNNIRLINEVKLETVDFKLNKDISVHSSANCNNESVSESKSPKNTDLENVDKELELNTEAEFKNESYLSKDNSKRNVDMKLIRNEDLKKDIRDESDIENIEHEDELNVIKATLDTTKEHSEITATYEQSTVSPTNFLNKSEIIENDENLDDKGDFGDFTIHDHKLNHVKEHEAINIINPEIFKCPIRQNENIDDEIFYSSSTTATLIHQGNNGTDILKSKTNDIIFSESAVDSIKEKVSETMDSLNYKSTPKLAFKDKEFAVDDLIRKVNNTIDTINAFDSLPSNLNQSLDLEADSSKSEHNVVDYASNNSIGVLNTEDFNKTNNSGAADCQLEAKPEEHKDIEAVSLEENLDMEKSVSRIQEFYPTHAKQISKNAEIFLENDDFDDFGDFSTPDLGLENTADQNQKADISNFATFDADFGAFASTNTHAFEDCASAKNSNISIKNTQGYHGDDDDFGDFKHPGEDLKTENTKGLAQNSKDDFGDFEEFSDFTKSSSSPNFSCLNEKESFAKSELILKEVFPINTDQFKREDYSQEQEVKLNGTVFDQLKDITDTKALAFLWSKSSSQNLLLKALNIDVRNILFGTTWNSSMPRFAANLSLAPLEPIKSIASVQSPVSTNPSIATSPQPANQNVDIPSAEFDWSGSGLTNPFDYSQTVLLDLENLASQFDIPNLKFLSPFPQSRSAESPSCNVVELDEWDYWLQTQLSKRPTSEKQLNDLSPEIFLEAAVKQSPAEKLDPTTSEDFNVYPSSYESSPYHVPLRETHINNKHTFDNHDSDSLGWLKPTILSPEVSRKNSQTTEIPDELYDFDLTVEDAISSEKPNEGVKKEALKEVISLSDNTKVEFALMPHVVKNLQKIETLQDSKSPDDFDEFSDFQAAPLPAPTSIMPQHDPKAIKTELVPNVILPNPKLLSNSNNAQISPSYGTSNEPLKPITFTHQPLTPSVILNPTSSSAAPITWPDPGGISEEDIKKFEGIYTKAQPEIIASKENLSINSDEKHCINPNKNESARKQSTWAVEDEWSDFTSSEVKNTTTPCKTLKTKELESFTAIYEAHTKRPPKNVCTSSNPMSNDIKCSPNPVVKQQTTGLISPKINSANLSSVRHPQAGGVATSAKTPKRPVKTNSLEDDDWSDFVSVKTQSPAHKRVTRTESRSSTPDLPLSVLNLGNLQPAKQPIPVITPQGLMQTKISSGNVLNIHSVSQNNIYQSSFNKPTVQPSLISNVFANQAYGGFNNQSTPNTRLGNQQDDEWSDFVSHQASSLSNVAHHRPQSSHMYQPMGFLPPNRYGGAPSHQSFAPNNGVPKSQDSVIQQNRRVVNNSPALDIPIPELDFVSSRGRSFNRK